jgi:hypothetical protein
MPWVKVSETLPMRLVLEKSRTERQRIIKKYFPRVSTELAYVLSGVFTVQSDRYTANELYSRIRDLPYLVSSSRRMLARDEEDEEPNFVADIPANYFCYNVNQPNGNGTKVETRSVALDTMVEHL